MRNIFTLMPALFDDVNLYFNSDHE